MKSNILSANVVLRVALEERSRGQSSENRWSPEEQERDH